MATVEPLGPGRIESRELEQEMRSSFLDYAMSVIVSRALPDVRDGLERAAFESQNSTPQELGAFLKDQLNVWGTVAREAGLQPY